MRRNIWASQARTLLILAPLQGQSILPFKTVLYHIIMDAFTLCRYGDCLCTVRCFCQATSFSRPGTWCARRIGTPSPRDENGIPVHQRLCTTADPRLCLCFPHSRSSRPRVCVCLSLIPAWAPYPSRVAHCRAARRRITPAFGSPLFLSSPEHIFGNASQQHKYLHTSLADTPRVP